jgi:hypothetical protein
MGNPWLWVFVTIVGLMVCATVRNYLKPIRYDIFDPHKPHNRPKAERA